MEMLLTRRVYWWSWRVRRTRSLRETRDFCAVVGQCKGSDQKRGKCQPQRGNDERRRVRLGEADKDRSGGNSQYRNEQADGEDEAVFSHKFIVPMPQEK